MDKTLRPYVAELIGTFAVVYLGAGVVCVNQLTPPAERPGLLGIALAEGFILAAALTATVNVSGGFLNPAVTLMLWTVGRIENATRFGWLIAAQLLGAALAGLCLRLTFAPDVRLAARLGAPHLNLNSFGVHTPTFGAMLNGAGVELALTFLLTFAIFGTVLDPRAPRLGGLVVGLTLAADVLLGFPLTGAAVNPARAFGPFLWELTDRVAEGAGREQLFVYWLGPVVGALLAGLLYQHVILPPAEPKKAAEAPGPVSGTLFRGKK